VEPTQQQHDGETIVPVRPTRLRAVVDTAAAAPKSHRPVVVGVLAAVVLLGVVFAVFFMLPTWVDDSRSVRDVPPPVAAPVAAVPAPPALSAEERAALQAQAEGLLAKLLTQQAALGAARAESWGGEQWARYAELGRTGDDAFLAEDFRGAVGAYTDAFVVGEELLGRSVEIVERALAASEQAILAGDAQGAIGQFDVVLNIDPEHAAAKLGRARAERLPDVLALVQRGDAERAAGDLEAALGSYRAALAIDPTWEPARGALEAVSGGIQTAQFERLMSLGFSALAAEEFADAEKHFREALELRPQAREAQDGLTQAEQGSKLDRIALTEARALAFERRELWDQAIAQYEAALATDATLAFALTGLERAKARAGLDAKLRNLIDNPTLLFGDSVLADARKLVAEAEAQNEPGPRLQEQIGELDRLITLASTPLAVELRSDQLTDVTLYRVGPLGVFTTKQVQLRPGTYTAVGSRDGYRDVRRTFTVAPGRELPPINVICVEPI
jgi:tetratricopeptide (TPR) repeat protein